MIQETQWAGHVAAMVSEEMDEFYPVPTRYRRGKYLLAFDPLDGSSNVDREHDAGHDLQHPAVPGHRTPSPSESDFLQPGTEQVCAGFALYGPATMLVLTTGRGVDGFTLDREIGAFVLTHPQMRIPEQHHGIRDQRVQRAVLGAAGQALRARSAWTALPAGGARISPCAGWRRWWRRPSAS